jgi:hypothetical protein
VRHLTIGAALVASLGTLIVSGTVSAGKQDTAKPSRAEKEIRRSLFSGNETILGEFGWLHSDCSASKPDARIITPPKNGSLRFEENQTTVTAARTALQKKCQGKPINAIQLYYRSNDKAGRDKIVIDLDTKVGAIVRYTYLLTIDGNDGSKAVAEITKAIPQTHVDRIVLSGNETRLAAPNFLNADCSSGPLPDLRIVAAPKHGTYRTEETSIAAERAAGTSLAACNGKPVNAVAIYYKPGADFTGTDDMMIDVDFKDGHVRRYVYAISVR